MRGTQTAAVMALSVIAITAVGCTRADQYVDPPANTYSVARLALATGSFGDTVTVASVLRGFFPASGARPLLGRFFTPGEYESAAIPVVVLSHELWTRRFKSDPAMIGTRVRLNGSDVTVVGVGPPGFAWPKEVSMWVPQSRK